MTTDFPTAPPAYGLEGPSAGSTVEKSHTASHTEFLTLPQETLKVLQTSSTDLSVPERIASAIRQENPDVKYDLLILLMQEPIDMYDRFPNLFANIAAWGLVGILNERNAKYLPAFLIHLRSGFEASVSGESACMVGVSIAAVSSAGTNHVEKTRLLGRHKLPRDIWANNFEDMVLDDKEIAKNTCLSALRSVANRALMDLRIFSTQ